MKDKKKNIEDIIDLSPMQEGILYQYLKDKESDQYFQQFSLNLSGKMNISSFKKAWQLVIDSNEMLRTVYAWKKLNKPVQIILKESPLVLKEYDFSEDAVDLVEQKLNELKAEDRREKFDLEAGPLFRIILCKFSDENYEMILSWHHILFDGWSMGIVLKEFFAYFNDFQNGNKLIKVSKNQFKDYIKFCHNQDRKDQVNYWSDYLKGIDTKTILPFDYKTEEEIRRINRYQYKLPENLTKKLEIVVRNMKVTVGSVFYAVWGNLLQKYSNTEEIIFGATVSGRPAGISGIEDIVGLFINTLPLRVKLRAEQKNSECIKNIHMVIQQRQQFETTPLVDIKSYSEFPINESLFDSIVVIENYPLDQKLNNENSLLRVNSYSSFEMSNFDLTLTITTFPSIELCFHYNPEVFKEETIKRLTTHFMNILNALIQNPEMNVADIEMLSIEEKEQLLFEFNNTMVEYPKDKTLQHLFEEQVRKTPDQIAVSYKGRVLSYKELNDRSNQLARVLRQKGVKRNEVVGLVLHRSIEMIIAIWASLKSAATYLPIDPTDPKDRINYRLKDSRVKVVLTYQDLFDLLENCDIVLNIDDERFYQGDSSNLELVNQSTDLAYIIYTSGTTGVPKGNLTAHYNISRIAKNTNYIEIYENDRVLQLSNYAFDGSTFDIFATFLNGATLVLIDQETLIDVDKLAKYLKDQAITVSFITTALFNLLVSHNLESLDGLRKIMFGGERASIPHVKKALAYLGKERLLNVYGPTESTFIATYYPINEMENTKTIPIGKPLANTYIYIVDQNNQPQPVGIAGELCIAGNGLALGYLIQSELTAEKFVLNPFKVLHQDSGEKMYKTGDLARWLPDGNIEFLGRIDNQVKIRGFRIELGEIENQLLKDERIKEAVVVDNQDEDQNKYLCGYIVTEKEVAISEIREILAKELPEYMIPAYFVKLAELPKTINGKIDRKALPKPDGSISLNTEYVAPTNEVEERLAMIWSEILGVEKIGINDNFFELGGHSLRATTLASKIFKVVGVEIEVGQIFKTPTIKGLADYIKSTEKSIYSEIVRVEESRYYELSSAQKRIFILYQIDENSISYNMPGAMIIEGNLDIERMESAFKELISRHEILRTSFKIVEGKSVQRVDENVEFKIEEIVLENSTIRELMKDFVRPFDLSKAPLLRVGVTKVLDKHVMLFDMHHIISDGRSINILTREVASLYEGNELPELRIQYKDFSAWQNDLFNSEKIKIQEEYWLNIFADDAEENAVPVLNLPTDFARPAIMTYKGDQLNFELEEELTAKLNKVAKEQGATMYMVLLAAYNILLSKYSGQEDIIVGSPIAGRPHVDLDNIIGMFVNTLAMRNYPRGDKLFVEFLADVKARALKAYENQDYQFEMLVEKFELERNINRNPLFDVMFVLQNMEYDEYLLDELKFTPVEIYNDAAKFDLTLRAEEVADKIKFSLGYSTDLFKKSTVKRMVEHFQQILRIFVAEPKVQIAEIEMLSVEERNVLLIEFNDTEKEYLDNYTIQQLFEEQVERRPDNIAVVFENNQLTYEELNQRSNQLARVMREKGAGPNQVIGIMVDRSIEMIIGIMGVLKAGGAYLPIDPDYPEERIKFLLKDSKTNILLTSSKTHKVNFEGIILDLNAEDLYQGNATNLECINKPQDLAYVIYTSGTTGKPKGVMIEHYSVLNLITGLVDNIYSQYNSPLCICLLAPYVFDASVKQICASLLLGHALYIVPNEVRMSGRALLEFYQQNSIEISDGTPAHMNLLLNSMESVEGLPVKHFIIGGEALLSQTVVKFLDKFTGSKPKITNIYGPAECCVDTTAYLIDLEEVQSYHTAPIGVPLANKKIYILDRKQKLVPIGVPGEIYISGEGLARGYFNALDLTTEKFVANPFLPGTKMYKTGDLARWLPDGKVEFLGRTDFQVKIRGHRIELGEIESCLLTHEAISEVVVIDNEDNDANKYLCAYLVSKKDVSVADLRNYLAKRLPDYMIPAYFMKLGELPKTVNGKINRKALPKPEGNIAVETEYLAPTNENEEKLVMIWSEVLGIEKIGINDNFFELGGHSLKATTLVARVFKELGVEIPLGQIFKSPTIKELANYIKSIEKSIYSEIQLLEELGHLAEYYEVSSAQKRLFILDQIAGNNISYNMPAAMTIEGNLDKEKMELAFKELITRHESLRTSFELVEGEIVQRIHEEVEFNLDYVVLDSEDQIKELIKEFVKPFDLSKAPLLRVGLIKTLDKHLILFDMHHIISDGTSLNILIREIGNLYAGIKLPELRIQYKDFSAWQNDLFKTEEIKKQEEYWLNIFAKDAEQGAIPVLNLPVDFARPAVMNFAGDQLNFELGKELTEKLSSVVKEQGATMYMLLLAAYNILLSKYSGQRGYNRGFTNSR